MSAWRIIQFALWLVPARWKPLVFRWAARISARHGHQVQFNIYRLPFNLVLKTTLYADVGANANEAEALHFLRGIHGVRAPQLVDCAADKDTAYTLMTWIDGDCCEDIWDKLTTSDKDRIVDELHTQLVHLHQQSMSHCNGTICAASGAPIYDPRLPWLQDDPRIFHSCREFFEQVWLGLDAPKNRDTIRPAIQPLVEREGLPIVFCHGDLLPKNLILPGGLERWRIGTAPLCLIDWEYAGWMPLCWEALKATWLVVDPDEDEWYGMMKRVFKESAAELEADWLWRSKSGITIL
ncbi:protein kinase subdomain-containing protein PKL [Trametes coccinea BRFM310]|uniref:Protein kinase subdomain-containing protein PKL n=1 Tax=Trametes coccinea (strain BRFM310) TaxID=1353009 RepID=A0A1Y2IZZ9_TRAC3|nr:protein kinase subdomain-containing protein PKL [Trametes coccinea BRFM310]